MSRRRAKPFGMEPLSPQKKWRAITIATLVLLPAHWALLAGLVSGASGTSAGGPNAAAALALGLAIVPFVFITLAVLSQHPNLPGAVLRAMSLAVLIGIPVSAIAGDAVTGIVAGVGAGGVAALRADPGHTVKARSLAVLFATVYTFALVRTVGALVLLPAPIFPFTALGIADHLSERSKERAATAS